MNTELAFGSGPAESDSVLRFATDRPALKVLPVALPTTRRSIGILTLKNRTLTPAAALFIEEARKVAKSFQAPLMRQ
jgi:hypothetical protein